MWTSASNALIINIARGECGFDGYVLTDMASSNGQTYMVYDDDIFNRTDLFLEICSSSDLDKWKNNPAFAQRMRKACHTVLKKLSFREIIEGNEFRNISINTRVSTNGH